MQMAIGDCGDGNRDGAVDGAAFYRYVIG